VAFARQPFAPHQPPPSRGTKITTSTVLAVAEYPQQLGAAPGPAFRIRIKQQCVGIGQSLRRLHHRHPMADPHVGLTEGPIDIHR
jgi:hypothetical protein